MNIGIDIDGVLTNEEDYVMEVLTKYCYENNLPNIINPLEYETNKFENSKILAPVYKSQLVWDYAKNWPARKYASEVTKTLKKQGNNLFIITSRYPTYKQTIEAKKMQKTIKRWLRKNKIYYNELYFTKNKVEQIQNLKLDVIIEDSPETIPTFVKHTKVFCFDNRYNTQLDFPNLTRVYSWYDILIKLNKGVNYNAE